MILADDHRLFREGLRKILEAGQDGIKVAGEGSDGVEALELLRQHRPDALLFDLNMPRMNGIELARELDGLDFRPAPVVVTAYDDEDSLATLSSQGVLGFVHKSSGPAELFAAIHAACRGESYADPRMSSRVIRSFSKYRREKGLLDELSPREKNVLYWMAQGLSNLEVAQKMVLSEKTVKNHVSHILKKLEIRDRTQAAILAWRLGFAQTVPGTLAQLTGEPLFAPAPRPSSSV